MENTENMLLLKKTYWQIQSVKTNFDRNGNVASLYMLLANPKIHQYIKKLYFTISDFVDHFGNPTEFTEVGISAACVGLRVQLNEFMEVLEEEPVQTKSPF